MLLQLGVPILQALDIVIDTVNNKVIGKAVEDVQESVREGESMAKPLARHRVFPPMVVQMIAVGEETGQVDVCSRRWPVLQPGGRGLGGRADLADRAAPDRGHRWRRRRGGVALYMPMFNIIKLIK